MCGILGLAGPNLPDDHTVAALRDLMSRRGPDGTGLWRAPGIVLAHRRLAVIDPTPAGAQPMALPDGSALIYNGELYNDADLRVSLASEGVRFATSCDTETILHALRRWGDLALLRLRGMFALAFFDAPRRRLTLARDPLGIKPLYYRLGPVGATPQLIFASEPRAILAHPGITARPDMVTVSGYLTTIRTTLGDRTLFDGIRTLRPGEVLTFDLSDAEPRFLARERISVATAARGSGCSAVSVRAALEDSIHRHLRSDVPTCCLLSGGLDSSIIAAVARRRDPALHTYCSGAPASTPIDGVPQSEDFVSARLVAVHLDTRHAEAPVTRELFARRWPEMVNDLGLPLSTPNEVAIHQVARRIRADGRIVTLSGEGADELFGGYDRPLADAAAFIAGDPDDAASARFLLDSAAWMPIDAKPAILGPAIWRALEGDAALADTYRQEFAEASAERDDADPLQSHLRFHRRVNLTGLLARLDTATMLAGVEGRTPFADVAVAALAESLPMRDKFTPGPPARTKIVLRDAFAPDLPSEVASRPKASFPLPFQEWIQDNAAELNQSAFAREVFTQAAIAAIAARPRELWRFAWPMINIALWGRRWWG
jgi:asparagine synthase (glutamine-hydrolysing)